MTNSAIRATSKRFFYYYLRATLGFAMVTLHLFPQKCLLRKRTFGALILLAPRERRLDPHTTYKEGCVFSEEGRGWVGEQGKVSETSGLPN